MQNHDSNNPPLKPYSKKELCALYGISDKTLIKWLQPFADEIGERIGRFYNIVQVRIIFKKLGIP